jgi:hypothetical protein
MAPFWAIIGQNWALLFTKRLGTLMHSHLTTARVWHGFTTVKVTLNCTLTLLEGCCRK